MCDKCNKLLLRIEKQKRAAKNTTVFKIARTDWAMERHAHTKVWMTANIWILFIWKGSLQTTNGQKLIINNSKYGWLRSHNHQPINIIYKKSRLAAMHRKISDAGDLINILNMCEYARAPEVDKSHSSLNFIIFQIQRAKNNGSTHSVSLWWSLNKTR